MRTKQPRIVWQAFNTSIIWSYCCFINIIVFFPQNLFGQVWELSFPSETRNGNFFINSPQNSDIFYLFGHDVKALNSNTQSLTAMPELPSDILFKEGPTGITAPYRHMNIFTLDDQRWWMVHEERILKTTNAGHDWNEVLSLNPNTQYVNSSYFTSIYFPSENVGYAVGTADKIFRTLDGGDTWEQLQWSSSTAPYRRLSNVYFVLESVGFVMGYEVDDILLNIGVYKPFYYYTTDAGQTWIEIEFPESDHHYADLQVVWDTTWYLVLTNRNFIFPGDQIHRSTDGGNHWEQLTLPGTSPISSLVLRAMHWFTPDEGIILGSIDIFDYPNKVYKTFDGGENWQEIDLDIGTKPFFGRVPNLVMTFNGDYGIISGASGNLLFSDDKGETWQSLQEGFPDIWDMSSDSGVTYAALYGQALLKHDNSGWQQLEPPLNSQYQISGGFIKIDNSGPNNVAIVDVFGELQYSENGGILWESLFTDLALKALEVQFINDQLSALVFDTHNSNNRLLYYPDVQNPQQYEVIVEGISLPASVFELFYVDETIFAKVENILFKRTNGTWQQVFINNASIRNLIMDEDGNAITKFSDQHYYYSNDSAETWEVSAFSDEILEKVSFEISTISGFGRLNENTHYALIHGSPDHSLRYNTYLILSYDNGVTWELVEDAIFSEPQDLGRVGHVVDHQGDLWVGSANAAIFRLLNGSLSVPEVPIESSFSVHPNPTNGVLNLKHAAHIKSYELFNLQGQLINSGQLNGNDFLEIPKHYPAGLYILNLKTINDTKVTLKVIKK